MICVMFEFGVKFTIGTSVFDGQGRVLFGARFTGVWRFGIICSYAAFKAIVECQRAIISFVVKTEAVVTLADMNNGLDLALLEVDLDF